MIETLKNAKTYDHLPNNSRITIEKLGGPVRITGDVGKDCVIRVLPGSNPDFWFLVSHDVLIFEGDIGEGTHIMVDDGSIAAAKFAVKVVGKLDKNVKIRAKSGSIQVQDVSEGCIVSSQTLFASDLIARGIVTKATLKSLNGDIRANTIHDATLQSAFDGDITVESATGNYSLTTSGQKQIGGQIIQSRPPGIFHRFCQNIASLSLTDRNPEPISPEEQQPLLARSRARF